MHARCAREVLEFCSVAAGTTTFPVAPAAPQRAGHGPGAAVHPADGAQRAVHQQGVAVAHAKAAQVIDEPLPGQRLR